MLKKSLMVLCLAASVAIGLSASLLIVPAAHAQAAQAKVGPKVGQLLQDALNASKQKKNGEALANPAALDHFKNRPELTA